MKANILGQPLDPTVVKGSLTALGGVFIYYVIDYLIKRSMLAAKRKRKRKDREQALRSLEERVKVNKPSDDICKQILSLDVSSLRDKMRAGDLAIKDVLAAYQHKALEAHKKTNCLVEPILEAEEWAADLEKCGNKEGLLYGVPVSIKDQFPIKGYDSSIGCSNWIDKPFAEDAVLIKLLKAEGAIPFVKTNVPQTMLSAETTNPIFGSTRNPQDPTRSAGGSSGGEGALIGAGGSPLGVGSDIGGSIRIPAHLNGICGFKPTSGRLSKAGDHPFNSGQNSVPGCYGPMGRDVDGCADMMRVFCGPRAQQLDPAAPNMPFDEQKYSSEKKLRIGYFTNESYCHAVPAMQRAVLETKERLEALGHELVPLWLPMEPKDLVKHWAMGVFSDGGKDIKNVMEYDSSDEAMQFMRIVFLLPVVVRKMISLLLWPFDRSTANLAWWTCGAKDVNELYKVNTGIEHQRTRVFNNWKLHNIDAMLSPAWPFPPLPFAQVEFAPQAAFYTYMYNVLDFPAGIVPVTKVTADDVSKMDSYPTHGVHHKVIKKGMVGTEGLSVGVQIATLPWQDEVCLRLMRDIEQTVSK